MRRLTILTIVITIVSLFMISTTTRVSAERVLTGGQRESIASSCQSIQAELDSLHSFDALMRVNLGQQYENILTSLMSPLNSRLSLNQVDTVTLVTTTVNYTDALAEFRNRYATYESSLRSVVGMDCRSDPAAFYTAIEEARNKRQFLRSSVEELNRHILKYRKDYRAAEADWESSRG